NEPEPDNVIWYGLPVRGKVTFCVLEKWTVRRPLINVMMRTMAGFAISTARITGSATFPPGALANVTVALPSNPRILRHTSPTTNKVRDNHRCRRDKGIVLYILRVLLSYRKETLHLIYCTLLYIMLNL